MRGTSTGRGFRLALDAPFGALDPKIKSDGVTNAASGLPGPPAPGEIVTIAGINIGPNMPALLTLDERGLVGAELTGVRVLFDDVPAPLLYVSL